MDYVIQSAVNGDTTAKYVLLTYQGWYDHNSNIYLFKDLATDI